MAFIVEVILIYMALYIIYIVGVEEDDSSLCT